MSSFFQSLLHHEITQRLMLYTGFIAFLVTWPIVNIVLKNDSFRIIGRWSPTALVIFLLIYAIFPVFLLAGIDYFLKIKNKHYTLFFRHLLFVVGAAVFWAQLVEYHLTPIMKGMGLVTTRLGNYGLYFEFFFGGLLFIFGVYKLRRYIPLFLKFLSPLMLFAVGLIFFTTLQAQAFRSVDDKDLSSTLSTSILQQRIYLLIFDGVSLTRLMENEEINKELFPTFYRLSQEWTWHRNAITNGASTTPVMPMMFSGRYYGDKLNSLRGFNNLLFQTVSSALNIHLFFGVEVFQGNDTPERNNWMQSIQHAVWLNKALFVAYLKISIPPPLRRWIVSVPFQTWEFDWRGEVPQDYRGKEQLYHGARFQKQFSNFLQESTNISKERGDFFLLWSMISHFPYIFDKQGNIIQEPKYHSFEIGMNQEAVREVTKNSIRSLQYVDSLIGLFLKQLEENGLYKDSVIIITSDHGINDTGSNYDINEDVFRIPFFLKAPGLEKGLNDRDVQTVDITPTIIDILGMPLSSKYHGQSLLRPYQERDKIIYALGVPGFWALREEGPIWQRHY